MLVCHNANPYWQKPPAKRKINEAQFNKIFLFVLSHGVIWAFSQSISSGYGALYIAICLLPNLKLDNGG